MHFGSILILPQRTLGEGVDTAARAASDFKCGDWPFYCGSQNKLLPRWLDACAIRKQNVSSSRREGKIMHQQPACEAKMQ